MWCCSHQQLNSSCPEGKVLGLWPAHFCHRKAKGGEREKWSSGMKSAHIWQKSQLPLPGSGIDEASGKSCCPFGTRPWQAAVLRNRWLPEAGPAVWLFAPFVCTLPQRVQGKRLRPSYSDTSIEFANSSSAVTALPWISVSALQIISDEEPNHHWAFLRTQL